MPPPPFLQRTLETALLSGRLQPNRNLVDHPPNSGYRGCRLTVTRSASCRVSARARGARSGEVQ